MNKEKLKDAWRIIKIVIHCLLVFGIVYGPWIYVVVILVDKSNWYFLLVFPWCLYVLGMMSLYNKLFPDGRPT